MDEIQLETSMNEIEAGISPESKEKKRKEKKKGQTPHYDRGYRGELICILLSVGCISYKGIHMLGGDFSMYTKKLKHMREEGITVQVKLETRRAERLSNYSSNKEKYLPSLHEKYPEYYEAYAKDNEYNIAKWKNKNSKEQGKAERAYRESEIFMLMDGAGTALFPGEKPDLNDPDTILSPHTPYYYPISEIKTATGYKVKKGEKKGQKNATINTRAIGCLISPGGNYIIYHSGQHPLKWERSVEGQISQCAAKIITTKLPDNQPIVTIQSCMIGVKDLSVVMSICQDNKQRRTVLSLNCGYNEMYVIPLNEIGRDFVNIMSRKDWKKQLLNEYLGEKQNNAYKSTVACDGVEGEKKYLLHCIPNIIRLQKFINFAEWMGEYEKFEIICFDFQKLYICEMAGKIPITAVSFTDYCTKYL